MRQWLTNKLGRWLSNVATPEDPQTYADFALKNHLLRRLGVRLGKHVSTGRNFDFFPSRGRRLIIDDHVNIAHDVGIYTYKQITIGSFTAIASHCVFTDGNHDISNHQPTGGTMQIGRGVFIGVGARLVGALTVGDNAVIAAGAVVLADVPAGMVVAGNPAKVIGRRPLGKRVWHFPNIWYDPKTYEILPPEPPESV